MMEATRQLYPARKRTGGEWFNTIPPLLIPTIMSTRKPNPRRTNGHKRNQLRKRALSYYDTCYLCGKPIDKTIKTPHPQSAEVDEIIPVSRGGNPYDWNNLRLTHRQCNQIKKAHTPAYAQAKIYALTHHTTHTTPTPTPTPTHNTTSQW